LFWILEGIRSVAVTADSQYIFTASSDNTIKMFDFETKQEIHHFKDAHLGTKEREI